MVISTYGAAYNQLQAPGARVLYIHTYMPTFVLRININTERLPSFDYLCPVPYLTLKQRRLLLYVNLDVTVSSSYLPVSTVLRRNLLTSSLTTCHPKRPCHGQVTRDGRLLISRRQTGNRVSLSGTPAWELLLLT